MLVTIRYPVLLFSDKGSCPSATVTKVCRPSGHQAIHSKLSMPCPCKSLVDHAACADHDVCVLLSQVKGMMESGCMQNGAQVNEYSDIDAASARDRGSEECSTTYHQAQDVSRADFKAIGANFQVSRSCTLKSLYLYCHSMSNSMRPGKY